MSWNFRSLDAESPVCAPTYASVYGYWLIGAPANSVATSASSCFLNIQLA